MKILVGVLFCMLSVTIMSTRLGCMAVGPQESESSLQASSASNNQDDQMSAEPNSNESQNEAFQMLPDYVIDDLAEQQQSTQSASGESVSFGEMFSQQQQRQQNKRSLAVLDQSAPVEPGEENPFESSSGVAYYPTSSNYFEQLAQARIQQQKSALNLKQLNQTPQPKVSPLQRSDLRALTQADEWDQDELRLLQQNQNKVGPHFIKEPPSFIHYLNSSDLVIPCVAGGNPAPTISWWLGSRQLKLGSLLDKRYVRYDNALVISAFRAHEFEPEIHSASYRCQANNPLGTIISRDVVINAVIDQDYEASVADQFVTVDNDALFKCQLPPQVRHIYQVIGWLEDGQQLASSLNADRTMPTTRDSARQDQSRAIMLPSGHLQVQRVQLRDANKSYKCQVKNLLSGRVSLSSISGRLFVTDADRSGASARIIDWPAAQVTSGRLGDSLLLTCLAQGSPRPTIRWFRRRAPQVHGGGGDRARDSAANLIATLDQSLDQTNWLEVGPNGGGGDQQQSVNSSQQQSAAGTNQTSSSSPLALDPTRFSLSSEANLLLLKALQPSDQRTRFKCLASNLFGAHELETELRLDSSWQAERSIELRPRLNFIEDLATSTTNYLQLDKQITNEPAASRSAGLALNCTVRMGSQPLVAVEWLKNGRPLFSLSLTGFNQLLLERAPAMFSTLNLTAETGHSQPQTLQFASLFDFELNHELTLIEHLMNQQQSNGGPTQQAATDTIQLQSEFAQTQPPSNAMPSNEDAPMQVISIQSSLDKLSQMSERQQYQQQVAARGGLQSRLWQSLRIQPTQDQLVYQLNFNSLRRSDRGSYQCRTRSLRLPNAAGHQLKWAPLSTMQKTSQLLLRDTPPKFVETFANLLVDSSAVGGESDQVAGRQQVSLKCIASGSPLPEISWSLSGFQVPDSSRFRVGDYVTRDGLIVSFVNISNVQPEDGGLYECAASNDMGQLRHSAWLNVTGPAHIRPMPNLGAIAGGSLQIMCPVGGWPIEPIVWFQNSTKLPANHRQKVFPNGTLIISELNEVLDGGDYSCQAKSIGSDHLAHQQIRVSIKVPPILEPFSFAKSLHRGQRYNIMCTMTRGDLPASIRWFKNGQPLEPSGSFTAQPMDLLEQAPVQLASAAAAATDRAQAAPSSQGLAIKQLDPYSSTLTFASLQLQHRGLYSCEATNEVGRANQSSTLVIHVPPEWRIEPNDLSVTLGRTVVIDCQADGFPVARVEWRLSQDLYREPPGEFKPIISSLYMRVFENGSLIIYNTQRTDAGYYLCQANNGVGPGISKVIKLTVHVAAHFKNKIRTELVRRGQPARLKCEAFGDLPLEISWLKDKQPLYGGQDEPRYSLTSTQLQEGLQSELNIRETTRLDSALFTCITQNQFGSDDTNIQLVVQDVPDAPDELRVQEYGARSARLSWTPGQSGNSPLIRYILMFANAPTEHHQPNSATVWTNITIPGNESSYLLQNLTPLTEYNFHLVALNSIGVSRLPDQAIKFRTDDEAPNSPPLFVKAQATSSRSIRVKWRAPERRRDLNYGQIAGFYVGYKLFRRQGESSANVVAAHQTAGESSANPNQMVMTQDANKQPEMYVYKTIEYQAASAVAGGAEPQEQTANKSSLEHECLLSGLRRGQKYLITVQPFNGRGAGPASEPVLAETWRVDVPDAPSLRVVARSTHSIHLAWRLASVASNQQQQVAHKLSPSAFKASQKSAAAAAAAAAVATSAAGLSRTDDEYQQMSPDELTLEEAQANEPILGFILTRKQLNPNLQGGSSSSQASAAGDNPPSQQQLIVELKLPADHMTHIVENLTCGTRYQFTIAAINSVGVSQPSEPLLIKTEGSVPVAPDRSSLLSLNASSVVINLGAWHNGACSMRSFGVLIKQSRSKQWASLTNFQFGANNPNQKQQQTSGSNLAQSQSPRSLVSNMTELKQSAQRSTTSGSRQQQESPSANTQMDNGTIVLDDLVTSVNYDLKILATNEAGTTEALYTFNTNGNSISSLDQQWPSAGGEFQLNEASLNELFDSTNSIATLLPLLLLILLVSLSLSTGCMLFARRRRGTSSNCSLSSSSRSNQSSNNYCNTTTTTTMANTGTNCHLDAKGNSLTVMHQNGTRQQQQHPADSPDGSPLLATHQHQMRLNEIYGNREVASNKSHYAYLTATRNHFASNRPSSPTVNTELTNSVLNGSDETEMCLGASALNLAAGKRHHSVDEQQLETSGGPNPMHQFYTSNTLNPSSKQVAQNYHQNQNQQLSYFTGQQQTNARQSQVLGKSSTLPSGCQQQQLMMQKLLLASQQAAAGANNEQSLFEPYLTTAGHMQGDIAGECVNHTLLGADQQQQAAAAAAAAAYALQTTAMQNATESGNSALVQEALNMASNLNLQDSIQHHQQPHQCYPQQMYATVKRGCPRPPNSLQQQRQALCEYTSSIYQCPSADQPACCSSGQASSSGIGSGDGAQSQAVFCFNQDQANLIGPNPQQQHHHNHHQHQQQQQQQQHLSDYQQLRPIN